jgi:hypothetical protein
MTKAARVAPMRPSFFVSVLNYSELRPVTTPRFLKIYLFCFE